MISLRIGATQAAALGIYVLDPAHDIDPESRAFSVQGSTLLVDLDVLDGDLDAAAAYLTEAANSADVDGDREFRDALTSLAGRLRRAKLSPEN